MFVTFYTCLTLSALMRQRLCMTDAEKKFIKELKSNRGIVGAACRSLGICRATYYNWKKKHPDFAEAAESEISAQVDFVEEKLLDLIDSGETAAIIFYMKTKGRDRGYGEKYVPEVEREEPVRKIDKKAARKLGGYVSSFTKALKDMGAYNPGQKFQIKLAAMLYTKLDMLKDEIFDKNHHTVIIEKSREGNNRETVSPLEAQFKQYLTAAQTALRGLGLNTDSKQKIDSQDGSDGFDEFYKEMNGT